MIFSKKKPIIEEYTVEQCNSCHKENKRKFKLGDILFSESGQCKSCQGKTFIEKIYSEDISSLH